MRDIQVYLRDIAECIFRIEQYVHKKDREDFFGDIGMQDAIIRRLEIIGEAVKQMPKEFKEQHVEVPWRNIAGMRDVFIHEYTALDLERVWRTTQEDVPLLKRQIHDLLDQNPPLR